MKDFEEAGSFAGAGSFVRVEYFPGATGFLRVWSSSTVLGGFSGSEDFARAGGFEGIEGLVVMADSALEDRLGVDSVNLDSSF